MLQVSEEGQAGQGAKAETLGMTSLGTLEGGTFRAGWGDGRMNCNRHV